MSDSSDEENVEHIKLRRMKEGIIKKYHFLLYNNGLKFNSMIAFLEEDDEDATPESFKKCQEIEAQLQMLLNVRNIKIEDEKRKREQPRVVDPNIYELDDSSDDDDDNDWETIPWRKPRRLSVKVELKDVKRAVQLAKNNMRFHHQADPSSNNGNASPLVPQLIQLPPHATPSCIAIPTANGYVPYYPFIFPTMNMPAVQQIAMYPTPPNSTNISMNNQQCVPSTSGWKPPTHGALPTIRQPFQQRHSSPGFRRPHTKYQPKDWRRPVAQTYREHKIQKSNDISQRDPRRRPADSLTSNNNSTNNQNKRISRFNQSSIATHNGSNGNLNLMQRNERDNSYPLECSKQQMNKRPRIETYSAPVEMATASTSANTQIVQSAPSSPPAASVTVPEIFPSATELPSPCLNTQTAEELSSEVRSQYPSIEESGSLEVLQDVEQPQIKKEKNTEAGDQIFDESLDIKPEIKIERIDYDTDSDPDVDKKTVSELDGCDVANQNDFETQNSSSLVGSGTLISQNGRSEDQPELALNLIHIKLEVDEAGDEVVDAATENIEDNRRMHSQMIKIRKIHELVGQIQPHSPEQSQERLPNAWHSQTFSRSPSPDYAVPSSPLDNDGNWLLPMQDGNSEMDDDEFQLIPYDPPQNMRRE